MTMIIMGAIPSGATATIGIVVTITMTATIGIGKREGGAVAIGITEISSIFTAVIETATATAATSVAVVTIEAICAGTTIQIKDVTTGVKWCFISDIAK